MNIPENTYKDTIKEDTISRIIKELETSSESITYAYGSKVPLHIAQEICREFVKKKYHAKINYFTDSRAAYQKFVISKRHLKEASGRLIYSEIYG